MASTTQAPSATIVSAPAFTRNSHLTIGTPTTAQVSTDMEVLKKLEERIDNHATFKMIKLPKSRGGDDVAARIEAQTIEQIARVKTVMAQLESWRDEFSQDRRHRVAQHV